MKPKERKIHLMTLMSFVLMALMLMIVSPTYVKADRILEGSDAVNWLISKRYIKLYNGQYWTQPQYTKFSNLMHSDPPSQDGLRGLLYNDHQPHYTGRKVIDSPVIVVTERAYNEYKRHQNSNLVIPNPPSPIGSNRCPDIGPPDKIDWLRGNKTLGISCHYHRNGKLHEQISWKEGVYHGTKKKFYTNGKKWKLEVFKMGKYTGTQRCWRKNRKKRYIKRYNQQGQLDGIQEGYSTNGILTTTREYSNGTRIH